MKKNKYKFIVIGLTAILLCGSCADLDREYSSSLNEKLIAEEYENARSQVANLYAGMQNGLYVIGDAMRASVSDEAEFTPQGDAQKFNSGSWDEYTNPDDVWEHFYTWIRRVNVYLNTIENIQVNLDAYKNDPSDSQQEIYRTRKAEVDNWAKEARFLRAYYYFELVKRYGGVPLIKIPLDINTDYSEINRNTLQECIDFIVDECTELGGEMDEDNDEDTKSLPIQYNDVNLGRVTRGAALALKSRILLYAASDLWNNPESWAPAYENKELVSVTGNRTEKWKAAAAAAKAVIELNDGGLPAYSMMTDYTLLGKLYQSSELILVRRMWNTNDFERNNYPAGYPNGSGKITPSQNLVDAFEMTDGSSFDWNNPEHAANPYLNRDPRLSMIVYMNGAKFKDITIETFNGGTNSKEIPNGTTTGYYLRKFIDANLNLSINQESNHPWVIFRITEMYLNYAEALNECEPGNSDIAKYVSMSRSRAGVNMPSIPASLNQTEMRERIRNERRVELAFEDHRLWDARRWLIAEKVLGNDPEQGNLYGINITKTGEDEYIYRKVLVESRIFLPEMYFYPIPANVLLNESVKGWRQNPLW